jgi:hypothetical protein
MYTAVCPQLTTETGRRLRIGEAYTLRTITMRKLQQAPPVAMSAYRINVITTTKLLYDPTSGATDGTCCSQDANSFHNRFSRQLVKTRNKNKLTTAQEVLNYNTHLPDGQALYTMVTVQ